MRLGSVHRRYRLVTIMPAGTIVASGSLVSPGGQQGVPGPNAVSTNAGNLATWGTDNRIYVPNPVPGGILAYVSTTQLSFLPFRGSYIKINGLFYKIPSSGVAGLANTGVYVEGVAGQTPAAGGLYYVYCFNNAGTLTADFSATGHVTSSTLGNEGTEIKSGDDTRTLLGLVQLSGGLFYDQLQNRYVRTWVNRKPVSFAATYSGAPGMAVGTWTVIVSAVVVVWADEGVSASVLGSTNDAATTYHITGISVDGSFVGNQCTTYVVAGGWSAAAIGWASNPGEGIHSYAGQLYVYNAGAINANYNLFGTIS